MAHLRPTAEPLENPASAAPAPFLWGVASAAHQIDGNNVGSDYWLLEHLTPTSFVEPSGDACDSWQRWREDLALVRGLNLNAYRFSVEWARVEPDRAASAPPCWPTTARSAWRCAKPASPRW